MGKKSDPPGAPPAIDANQSAGQFLFGSDWDGGQGITDDVFQERLTSAEAKWGPEYLANALGLQETGLFGRDGQAGLLELYERSAPIVERMRASTASAQRGSDVEDMQRYGRAAVEAIRNADPERAALIARQQGLTDDLYDRAEGLTPQQRRMAVQGAREATAARGREMDNTGIFAEVLGREEYQRANRQEAQGAGQSLYQMLQGSGGDAMLAVLGRPSQSMPYATQMAGSAMGFAGQASPQLFSPDAGINLGLQNNANLANYQASVYGAQQARTGAIMGGLFSGLGALGGGLAGRGG